jgi:hypothetical protein
MTYATTAMVAPMSNGAMMSTARFDMIHSPLDHWMIKGDHLAGA